MHRAYYAYTRALEEDPALFDQLYKRVPPSRREKTERCRQKADRCLSLGAGALLDYALRVAGIDSYEIDYGRAGEGAKPVLTRVPCGLHFNLSHSHGAVMCVLASGEVGCDVEKVREGAQLKIADRFFSRQEQAALQNCPGERERRELFFRLWTLRESFMKATGLGMKLAMDAFSIALPAAGSDAPATVLQQVDSHAYTLQEFAPGDGYRYALCVKEKNARPVRMEFVDLTGVW